MKVILTGITSFRNHGVEALVTTIIEQLRKRLPDPQFLVLDRGAEYDQSRLQASDVRFAVDLTAKPYYSSRLRKVILSLSNTVGALAPDFQSLLKEFQDADLVVATGGDVFASEYGHQSLLGHLAPLRAALALKKPIFFAAHSIGPFKTAQDRNAFMEVAVKATGISVREGRSYEYLIQELKLPKSLVTLTADPAFLLTKPGDAWLGRVRPFFGVPTVRPLVALNPSQAICNWMQTDDGQHLRVWCEVVRLILDELGASVILIPHVQELSPKNDDRVLCTAIMREFSFDPRVQIAGADYTASEFKGIISQCDMVVSERMHACIAGLSSGICTVAIGYSVKAEGILQDLFEPEMVRNGLLVPITSFLDERIALDTTRKAWAMRHQIHDRLKEVLPGIKARSAMTFDLIARAMGA